MDGQYEPLDEVTRQRYREAFDALPPDQPLDNFGVMDSEGNWNVWAAPHSFWTEPSTRTAELLKDMPETLEGYE